MVQSACSPTVTSCRRCSSPNRGRLGQLMTRSAAGQEAEGALLLEVQGTARAGGDAAEAAAEIRDGGADRRLGEHPQTERQRRRADVIPALELERGRDRLEVRLAELPVRR